MMPTASGQRSLEDPFFKQGHTHTHTHWAGPSPTTAHDPAGPAFLFAFIRSGYKGHVEDKELQTVEGF